MDESLLEKFFQKRKSENQYTMKFDVFTFYYDTVNTVPVIEEAQRSSLILFAEYSDAVPGKVGALKKRVCAYIHMYCFTVTC